GLNAAQSRTAERREVHLKLGNCCRPRESGDLSLQRFMVRGKAPYSQRTVSPWFRTPDRIVGVGMGPRFRGDDKEETKSRPRRARRNPIPDAVFRGHCTNFRGWLCPFPARLKTAGKGLTASCIISYLRFRFSRRAGELYGFRHFLERVSAAHQRVEDLRRRHPRDRARGSARLPRCLY